MEVWKSIYSETFPTQMYQSKTETAINNSDRVLRASSVRELKDFARTRIGENSFCVSAGKLWNQAQREIKEAININMAKRLIKAYSLTMPI